MSDTQFFVTGGTLGLDAESYVPRSADRELFRALSNGDFCYVLTSRQMGKSSLMVRNAARLKEDGVAVVILDLTALGQNLEPGQWYAGLLARIGEKMNLEDKLEDYWDTNAETPPLLRWMNALRQIVLGSWAGRMVIFIDEIDYVRSLPFTADEFFAAIRECYNRRTEDPKLGRLTFCLLGVATPSDLIRDQRMTPFNIGRAIELRDFAQNEAAVLSNGLHQDAGTAAALLLRILHWTNGHPYLTQKLCQAVAARGSSSRKDVDAVCNELFLSVHARERDDNLHFVRERLLRSEKDRAALLDLYGQIVRGTKVMDDDLDPLIAELRLTGIIRADGDKLTVRNLIYSRVFDRNWIRNNLPDAERERQRSAFWRGVRRTVTYSAVVMVIMAFMALALLKSVHEKDALAKNLKETLEETKVLAANLKTTVEEKTALATASESAKKEVVSNLVTTQARLVKLLQSIEPLLGSKSKAREEVLQNAQELQESASGDLADLPEIQMGQADLARVYSSLYNKLGNDGAAVEHAQKARSIVKDWLAKDPANLELKRQLVNCHIAVGDATRGDQDPESVKRRTREHYDQALVAYKEGVTLVQRLLDEEPANDASRKLAVSSWNKLGDVQLALKDISSATNSYKAAQTLTQRMLKERPDDTELSESLALSYDRTGDVCLENNRAQEALILFEEGLTIRVANHKRAEEETMNAAQISLAQSFNKLGRAHELLGNGSKALENFERGLTIRKAIQKLEPRNFELLRNLCYSYSNVGSALRYGYGNPRSADEKQRARDRAIECFHERRKLAKFLYDEDPGNPDWRSGYAEALYRCADTLLSISDRNPSQLDEALRYSRQAAELSAFSDARHLCVMAQALRLNRMPEDARAALERARKLLLPEAQRSKEQRQAADAIARELQFSANTPGQR